jgi:uncharacterized membrane protein YoaK (UPF0700 family)
MEKVQSRNGWIWRLVIALGLTAILLAAGRVWFQEYTLWAVVAAAVTLLVLVAIAFWSSPSKGSDAPHDFQEDP